MSLVDQLASHVQHSDSEFLDALADIDAPMQESKQVTVLIEAIIMLLKLGEFHHTC